MSAAFRPQIHTILPAADFVARGLATRSAVSGPEINPDPIPAHGELRTHTFGHKVYCDPLIQLEIPNAIVHGPEGVVTTGRYVLAESTIWTDPDRSDACRQDDLWISLNTFPRLHLQRAEHLLCGYGNNYYHWLMDGMGRLAVSQGDPTLLVPGRSGTLGKDALRDSGQTLVGLGHGECVAVDRLSWTSNMTGSGGAFHPAFRDLRDRMFPDLVAGPHDRIYVSRRDSRRRRLLNEAAVEDLCRHRGFVVVTPSRMSVAEQASVFRGARWVVAPHGASLANLVFCSPGTAVLELLMDTYLNWCNRQLAACMHVNYGCVIGRSEAGDPKWVHGTPWTIDLDRLARAIDDPLFGAGGG